MSKNSMKKDGTLYYRQTDFWRLLGAGLMIVGVVWFYIGYSMASYYIPCVITPAGLILFLVFSSRHVSDADMDEERTHRLMDYDTSVTSRGDYSRVVLRQPSDVETEAYHMGEPATCYKRNKNGALVSDRFVKSHFFFTADGLWVVSRTLSMTVAREEEGAVADAEYLIPYAEMQFVSLSEASVEVTMTASKKTATARMTEVVIMGKEGELLRLPVQNDMDMSNLCDALNRKIKESAV